MTVGRFNSIVSRMNSVRWQLEREQRKDPANEIRLVRAKALLLRLQAEMRDLAERAVHAGAGTGIGGARLQPVQARLQTAGGAGSWRVR